MAHRSALPPDPEGEPAPPPGLAELQARFAAAITTPLLLAVDAGAGPVDYSLQVSRYPEDLVRRLRPGRGGSGGQRLAVYNRQYWFRLLTVLQKEHPLLRHLLGVARFNRLGMAYLQAHPPRSFTLRDLSAELPAFLATDPEWGDALLHECATLERLHVEAFDRAAEPPLDAARLPAEEREALLLRPLRLQPHVGLFEEHWNLVELYPVAKADEDDARALAAESRHSFHAIYRDASHQVRAEPLEEEAFRLLERLREGAPLAQACATLDEALAPRVAPWFARWTALRWFRG